MRGYTGAPLRSRRRLLILLTAIAVPLAACERERTPTERQATAPVIARRPAAVTAESAGARVIAISPRSTATARFVIEPTAVVSIGGLADNPDRELRTGADVQFVRRSDGSLVLSDGDRLRLHAADGKLQRMVGRNGAGPGEFRRLAGLCLSRGDTLVAYDGDNRRIGVYDPALTLVRELPLVSGSMSWRDGCLSSGHFLVERSVVLPDQSMVIVERHPLRSGAIDTVGHWWASDRNRFIASTATVLALGAEILHADPRSGTLTRHDGTGGVIVRMQLAESRRAIPPSERSALTPSFWTRPGSDPAMAKGAAAILERADRPTHYPLFGGVLFDGAETIWLLEHRTPPHDPWVYSAVTLDGVPMGRLVVPAQRTLDDPAVAGFTPGGVLLRRHDANGALVIAEHRLTRAAPTGAETTP